MTEYTNIKNNSSPIDGSPLSREARSISIEEFKKYFPLVSGNINNPTALAYILNKREQISEGSFKVLERLNHLRSKGVLVKPNHREMLTSIKKIYGKGASLSTVTGVYKFIDHDISDANNNHHERTNACIYFLKTRINTTDRGKAERNIRENAGMLAWLLTIESEVGATSKGLNECLIAIYELSSGFRNTFTSSEVQKRVLTNVGVSVSSTTVSKSKELANRLA